MKHEPLKRIRAGVYVTHDGRFEVRQIPRDSGAPDAGTWHVGYPPDDSVEPLDATNAARRNAEIISGGEAISDRCEAMWEARDELAMLRAQDASHPVGAARH